MCQAVFYQAGEVRLPGGLQLQSATPGIVLLQQSDTGKFRLTVADPNRELGKMMLSISTEVAGEGPTYRAFWNEREKFSSIIIELPDGQDAGSSRTIEF